jgi:SAM-dependent methyltransferase
MNANAPRSSSILNSQFSILNSQFSILNPQSSILNSQFSILNPQFSILNSQSSILNPSPMPPPEAYAAFAYAYDKALGERFFGAVRPLVDEVLGRYPTERRTHLDLACGTGLVGEHFRRMGWRSFGVDASIEMLRAGRNRGAVAAGDVRAVPLRGTFARITCLFDSLNHLLELEDLVAAFRSVRAAMDAGSLFLFDVNHPEIYPVVWGLADPFVAHGADFHLEIDTTYRRRARLGRAKVSGWAKVDGRRIAIREERRQRAYSRDEVMGALAAAGLRVMEVVDFDPYEEPESAAAPTVKWFFTCGVA